MDHAKLEEHVVILSARVTALRVVVARLLAYELDGRPNARAILDQFADAADLFNYEYAQRPAGQTPNGMLIQQAAQKEVDLIVAAAQKMLE